MESLPSSSHFPPATPQFVGGQASRSRGSLSSSVSEWTSLTGDFSWPTTTSLASSEHSEPDGFAVPAGRDVANVGVSVVPGVTGIPSRAQATERPLASDRRAALATARPVAASHLARIGGAGHPDPLQQTSSCPGGKHRLRNTPLAPEDAVVRIDRVGESGGDEFAANVSQSKSACAVIPGVVSRSPAASADGARSVRAVRVGMAVSR